MASTGSIFEPAQVNPDGWAKLVPACNLLYLLKITMARYWWKPGWEVLFPTALMASFSKSSPGQWNWKWRSNNKNQDRSTTSDTYLNGCCFEKEKGKRRARGHPLPARGALPCLRRSNKPLETYPIKVYKLGIGISLFVLRQFIWLLSKALVCSRGDAFCCCFEKFN